MQPIETRIIACGSRVPRDSCTLLRRVMGGARLFMYHVSAHLYALFRMEKRRYLWQRYVDNWLPTAKHCYDYFHLFYKKPSALSLLVFIMCFQPEMISNLCAILFLISSCLISLNLLVICLNLSKSLVICQIQLDR